MSTAYNSIRVDFSKPYGKVKPFNAINNGPAGSRVRNYSNFDAMCEAKFPYSRNHDASFRDEWLVDVHRIFRDFDADETDPKNYNFGTTDKYVKEVFDTGCKVYYRLGASIEHGYKYGTYPPKDFNKWARICEHIIRHYTEGWADGFNYDIEYWEIWNEAECTNADGSNPCWQGTPDEFAEFFITACRYLQSKFPHLKIGGPAIATVYHTEWCENFFDKLRASGVRPDFISYHRYNKTVEDFVEYVRAANELFARYGFGDIETHLNEWNYVRGWQAEKFVHTIDAIKGIKGASFTTGVMCACHPEKLDMLMYYDGRPSGFCGLWDGFTARVLKGYYPFLAYSRLRELGTAVESESDLNLYALGATDGSSHAALFTYFTEEDNGENKSVRLELKSLTASGKPARVKIALLDSEHNLECIREETVVSPDATFFFDMPPYSTYLVEVSPI